MGVTVVERASVTDSERLQVRDPVTDSLLDGVSVTVGDRVAVGAVEADIDNDGSTVIESEYVRLKVRDCGRERLFIV